MTAVTYSLLVDWNDDGDFSDTGEDVTARTLLGSQEIQCRTGRDQARAVSAIAAGETAFELNNESRDYTPDNSGSPLYGNLEPGRPVLFRAVHLSQTYNLFRGFLDGYEMNPTNRGPSTVKCTALDMFHKIKQATLSTRLYESVQTGEAINHLLDEIGWPSADRDIDQGATTLRYWWEDGTDGFEALKKIVESEGAPGFAWIDGDGKFVFRDRHHRYTRTASKTVQATFRSVTTEPLFSEPFHYDIGWRDLINQVIIEVPEREKKLVGEVWSTESSIVLEAGESITLEVKANDPFTNAITPVVGTDVILRSGSSVGVTMSRTSGQSTKIVLTATAAIIIDKVVLRAESVPVMRTIKITVEDSESIAKHGVRTMQDNDPAWANKNDAFAIASVIIGQRAERLPVVQITVKNANDTRTTQILSRVLSDRIHITETADSGVDFDFFIEQIQHTVSKAGKVHNVVFGCEKAVSIAGATPNYFTFDKAGSGFNDGLFGGGGEISSAVILILDDATNGKLDTGGLGY